MATTSDAPPTAIRPSAPVSITLHYLRDAKHVAVTIDVGVVDAHRNADGSYPPIVPDESSDAALLRAAWWREAPSVAPAVPSLDGSTYVYGHACPNWACAFDDLHLLHAGDVVTVTTATGVFDYVVQTAPLAVPKSGPHTLSTSSIYDPHPGVLWLITCGYTRNPSNGQLNSTYNWIVGAGLRSARVR
ncbi:MAG TPA: sortase [Jatrophihabitantaceae bacterium]|nr:sortase [Jatrophihabitantaceae bacterium]